MALENRAWRALWWRRAELPLLGIVPLHLLEGTNHRRWITPGRRTLRSRHNRLFNLFSRFANALRNQECGPYSNESGHKV